MKKFLVFALLSFASTAQADGVPVTGTAGLFSGNEASIRVQGTNLNLFSGTDDFSSFFRFPAGCAPNTVCDVTLSVPSRLDFQGLSDFGAFCPTCNSFNGVVANIIGGRLTFSGSGLVPGFGAATIPITVAGTLVGYQVNCLFPAGVGCTLGSEVWSLAITGTGTGQFL